ncbi:ribonuclease P 40kDa subunit-domain-containing protein [Paraphoma chrysanthemicola]|uniref:Ribonuclease P 40kDa subunit-domain-containing protein n=1 Tax=Paraphoma chrysanthemicola TaxID=798071 RepID=A0A8K0RIU9_9PLEO|nr:ribonuclease P 40kDa subunit-domain-containing protein [Paraphoma chrysanthemicola]
MLDIHRTDSAPDTKVYFTHSILPSYIDPQNVSTKKQPFTTTNKQHFSHTVDLILPAEIYELVQQKIDTITSQYARVHMKLGEILESDFLDSYIKQGNIMMLSEGRPLVDNRFELYDGILRMELDRPTYERCGLQGTPMEDGGKKHKKQRWVVTYDLKLPSMKHGKGAFSRLVWACKNVLDRSLTWLFYNFNPSSAESLAEGKEVLSKHAPWIHKIEPVVTILEGVLVPKLVVADLTELYDQDESISLLEYLHLLSLDSPRVRANDNINPHLSRYEVPDFRSGVAIRSLACVRWRGFMPPAFIRDLFLAVKKDGLRARNRVEGTEDVDMDGREEEAWFALSAQGFGGKNAWTVMQFESRDTLTWESES